ncbi:2-oxoglutarate dehydrogenase complex dihydrolipoyllysine-residue succinyltransferase [Hyphobacterium marinum]|uniref:Dihydrolipoyllysine-residue succinyltransferase component of 2-oxoglutarate dehydrogenase complex n=1 Tax=Hyphobacterium marinum TaxID=3116574 RepID=A0ABU7LW75_9PROT|nr:2-oxoglutarate dehydrogenase complex dihydrolipoyllysine-residue succinyltransferase [Hyphobacterium sp. Y6023]MEE2565532.1 2-oxoglutarate dehydrogenase complex dihydrolipoyllysine-residue succinyltransferase [Hyphobacterium sp. Y6023]
MTDITVPQLGESVSEATVGAWNFAEGDAVKKDDVLVELETDKVAIEVRAEADGTLAAIVAKEGDTVEIGAKLAELSSGDAAPAKAEDTAEAKAEPAPEPEDTPKAKAETSKDSGKSKPKKDEDGGGGGNVVDASIPEMGESVTEGIVGAWLVDVGAAVKKDQALVEIETDKVAVEVPCPVDGIVAERLAEEGDTVSPGDVIARIREGAGGGAEAPAKADAPKAESKADDAPVKAMPAAKRVAAEHDLDLAKVEGTGKDGRVTKGDALAALKSGGAAPDAAEARREPVKAAMTAPEVTEAQSSEPREERVRMSRLRQTIARRLKEAQNTAAMLTTFNEADMSAIMKARKTHQEAFVAKHGVKLGFMSFFVKACVSALKDIPNVNAEIDGDEIVYKNYYNMGVAVSTERGLVVPVLRDADRLSLADIEKEIVALGAKARDGKLSIEDMQGATFTLSNGGIFGSLLSTPILNAPQSGILGMHKIQERPIAENGQVVIRPMMYLALSYDHRIVDGKEAVTFLVRVKDALEDPQRLLFDI